jgi:hypothetical protein
MGVGGSLQIWGRNGFDGEHVGLLVACRVTARKNGISQLPTITWLWLRRVVTFQ